MRHTATHNAPWPRRIAALTGAVGLLCLGALAPATAMVKPSSTLASGGGGTARIVADNAGAATTATGPYMWNGLSLKKGGAYYPTRSTVKVSQTDNLTNQFVTVSWTGFTPSKGFPGIVGYSPQFTMYPVQVAECAGTDPAGINANCNGLDSYIQGPGKAGPTTEVDALTGAAVSSTVGGSGSVNVQILTDQQDSFMGCSSQQACSLVILPVDGGEAPATGKQDCNNHTEDSIYAVAQTVISPTFATANCAWNDRIVIPLHFAPGQTGCNFSTPDFTVVGSPMMQRAMNSWISKLCVGSDPDRFLFTNTLNEPAGRLDFLDGSDDVALTTEPANAPANGRTYTYAPVGISATVVAYWMDSPKTGQPYTDLKLTARLVTKLITETYNFAGWGCTRQDVTNPPEYGCDNAVEHNPRDPFDDPDFQQYNPTIKGNTTNEDQADWPTVLSGNSDMTWELTRWIAANTSAMSFLDGNPDPWGTRVNLNFQNLQLPAQALESQDPYKAFQLEYSPQFPLTRALAYQADNWDPGYNIWNTASCAPEPCAPPPPPANPNLIPGSRDLVAILDEADAAGDDFPTAALQNNAGDFVAPTLKGMAAAVDSMTTSSNGITMDDNEDTKNPDAYPLTMVVYAMVPTSHTSKQTAQKISQWLDFVAGSGQSQGPGIGQLPYGYLPLTKSMRQQTLKAAYEVLHQTGAKPPGGYHSKGGTPASTSGSAPKSSSSPKPSSSSPTSSATSPAKVNAAYSSPDADGAIRWVLPILLVLGALMALAGPAAIVLSRPGGRAAVAGGWHRITKFTSHLGRNA
jgi:PBP superfamily domain